MLRAHLIPLIVAVAWLGLAAPAAADQRPAPTPTVQSTQEQADAAIVQAAVNAMGRGGFAALRDHLPALNEVCARAPARYMRVEITEDRMLVRDSGNFDPIQRAMLQALADGSGQVTRNGQPIRLELGYNTYGLAFLLRGSYAVEMRAPETALQVLNQGLAMQPDNLDLVNEKGAALVALRQFDQTHQLLDAAINANPAFTSNQQRARLHRGRGFALIELGRLDEAEADYRRSLELEPNNAVSRNELTYIGQLRAGRPPVEPSAPFIPGAPNDPTVPKPALPAVAPPT